MSTLPDPPALVLAKRRRGKRRSYKPRWYFQVADGHEGARFGRFDFPDWTWAKDLRVVEHPRNDERAIQIIEAARK